MEDETAVLDDIFNEEALNTSENESASTAEELAEMQDKSEREVGSNEEAEDPPEVVKTKKTPAPRSPRKGNRNDSNTGATEHNPAGNTDKIMEARRDFEEALQKIKTSNAGKGRRKFGEDGEAGSESVGYDELAVEFTNKMMAAVRKDDESVAAEKPALAKLKLLGEVSDMLTKKHMQEVLLDNQVLSCIKRWLEPNPRGHFAVHSIRKRLLELLQTLPIETVHLRESGLGKIVMFYYSRKEESADIRKLAGDLVTNWSRPIIGTNLDYRQMIQSAKDNDSAAAPNPAASAPHIQSDKFKMMARSGALDRDTHQDPRYRRLTSALNRQKSKKH